MAEQLIKSVFSWEYFSCYLCGPIDFDRGSSWRNDWTKGLIEIGFTPPQILNPQNKPLPKGIFEFDLDNEAELIDKHRKSKDYSGLCRIMSQIAHVDLRLCDHADLILVNFTKVNQQAIQHLIDKFEETFDQEVVLSSPYLGTAQKLRDIFYKLVKEYLSLRMPTYGTIHEMVSASNQHKPIMIVWEGGKETCSGWIMWLVGERNVFSSFEELKAALKQISEGKKEYNAKDWLLFDFGRNGKV